MAMISSPAKDVADMIIQNAQFNLKQGSSLTVGIHMETPGRSVALYDMTREDAKGLRGWDEVRVDMRVRGEPNSYSATYNLAESIVQYLHGKTEVVTASRRYVLIQCTNPGYFGSDVAKRPIFQATIVLKITDI